MQPPAAARSPCVPDAAIGPSLLGAGGGAPHTTSVFIARGMRERAAAARKETSALPVCANKLSPGCVCLDRTGRPPAKQKLTEGLEPMI